jgi:beta-lactamase superfamily II metal-dependent hydrolase
MMMDSPELVILDVGHGNCSLVIASEEVVVVDCADGNVLLEFLEQKGIKEITHVLVSHADTDHVAGIVLLLSDQKISVRNLYVNPDNKNTETWRDFRFAALDAQKRGTHIIPTLTTSVPGKIEIGSVQVEVIAPSASQALGGVGGKSLDDRQRTLTSNSLSAVVAIIHNSHRVALLAGDVEQIGLNDLLTHNVNIKASILVFPHHGGRPGDADAKAFARQLCTHVTPKLVIFSNARGGSGNPREDIVQGIKLAAPDVHIVCTQLSKKCSDITDSLSFNHLSDLPSEGSNANKCCGGSLSISLNGVETYSSEKLAPHRNFVDTLTATPLCRKIFSS